MFTPAVCFLAAGIFFHGTLSVCVPHIWTGAWRSRALTPVPPGLRLFLIHHLTQPTMCSQAVGQNCPSGCLTRPLSWLVNKSACKHRDCKISVGTVPKKNFFFLQAPHYQKVRVELLCFNFLYFSVRKSLSCELLQNERLCWTSSYHTQTSSFKTPGMCLDVPRSLRAGGKNILWLLSRQGKFSSVPQFKLPWIMDRFSESLGM